MRFYMKHLFHFSTICRSKMGAGLKISHKIAIQHSDHHKYICDVQLSQEQADICTVKEISCIFKLAVLNFP